MKPTHSTILALLSLIVMGALTSSAQQPTLSIKEIAQNAQWTPDAQWTSSVAAPASEAAINRAMGISAASTSSASFISPVPVRQRVITRGYLLLNGLHLGMAIADIASTQHCIADHHCAEGNPLMPSSAAGKYGVSLALVGSSAFFSYHLKKRGNALWWMSPTFGTAAHTLGVGTGIAHR